jgi:DNA-directed RNA polymerase subunit alpha
MQNIPLPQKPNVIEKQGNRAVFQIEDCYPGYGVTLGNALRRVLLSSLPGASITGVKIKGVQHEFSTIPGVIEDVIEIILNLKQVRFKLYTDEPVSVNLLVKGAKEVKAGDVKTTADIEVINKDAHIATISDKKGELEMEIKVEKGLGFVPAETRKKEKLEIGLIAIDAIFSPIKKANFTVENMRVGERTDFNRIKMEVETDGSISPEDAFIRSSEILNEQFDVFLGMERPEEEKKQVQKEEEKEVKQDDEPGKIKIEDLKLSTRTINALKEGGVKSLGSLAKKSEASLLELEGMGDKGIGEIKKILKKYGLELK